MYMSGTAETVRYAPDRAKELLETGPREYDRLPVNLTFGAVYVDAPGELDLKYVQA